MGLFVRHLSGLFLWLLGLLCCDLVLVVAAMFSLLFGGVSSWITCCRLNCSFGCVYTGTWLILCAISWWSVCTL